MCRLSELLKIGFNFYSPISGSKDKGCYNAMCYSLVTATQKGLIQPEELGVAQGFCKDLVKIVKDDEEWLVNAVNQSFKVSDINSTMSLIYNAVVDKLESSGN